MIQLTTSSDLQDVRNLLLSHYDQFTEESLPPDSISVCGSQGWSALSLEINTTYFVKYWRHVDSQIDHNHLAFASYVLLELGSLSEVHPPPPGITFSKIFPNRSGIPWTYIPSTKQAVIVFEHAGEGSLMLKDEFREESVVARVAQFCKWLQSLTCQVVERLKERFERNPSEEIVFLRDTVFEGIYFEKTRRYFELFRLLEADELVRRRVSSKLVEERNGDDDLESLALVESFRCTIRDLFEKIRSDFETRVSAASSISGSCPVDYEKTLGLVLVHTDLHGWNVLKRANGDCLVGDWDEVILAPPERDLIFFSKEHQRSVMEEVWNLPMNEEMLRYYHGWRLLEDIAELFEKFWLIDRERDAHEKKNEGFYVEEMKTMLIDIREWMKEDD